MPEMIAPKVLSFASILDDTTRSQAHGISTLPFIHPHVALMPDAHAGKGSAVGTVIPTIDAVIPAAVGVDIGCGMIGVQTSIGKDDIAGFDLADLRRRVESTIPLSPGNYNKAVLYPHTASRIAELDKAAAEKNVDLSHSPEVARTAGFTRRRQPLHRVVRADRGRWHGKYLVVPALGQPWRRQQDRAEAHQDRPGAVQASAHPARPPPRPCSSRRRNTGVRRLHPGVAVGTAVRLREPGRDDGPVPQVFGEWLGDNSFRPADVMEVRRINCHHNYTEKVEIADRAVWLTRKGGPSTRAPGPTVSSRDRWAPSRMWCAGSGTSRDCSPHLTVRAGGSRGARPRSCSPSTISQRR